MVSAVYAVNTVFLPAVPGRGAGDRYPESGLEETGQEGWTFRVTHSARREMFTSVTDCSNAHIDRPRHSAILASEPEEHSPEHPGP